MDRTRTRKILKRAANWSLDSMVKSWLICDEQGTWESAVFTALSIPLKGEPEEDEVDNAIAIYVALQAMDAAIAFRKKKDR